MHILASYRHFPKFSRKILIFSFFFGKCRYEAKICKKIIYFQKWNPCGLWFYTINKLIFFQSRGFISSDKSYLNILRDSPVATFVENSIFPKSTIFQLPLQSRQSVRKLFWQLFWLPVTFLDNPRCFVDTVEVCRIDFWGVENLDILGVKIQKNPKFEEISKNIGHLQLRNFVCVSALVTGIYSSKLLKFEDALFFHSTD